jgi:long-chain acyl-CoA synthetase
MTTTAPHSLVHSFRDAVARDPEGIAAKICVQDAWVDRTWTSMAADVDLVILALQAAEIAHGDRIAIMAPTCLQWVVLELAVFSIGAVVVPIYPTSGVGDIEHVLNDAGVRLAFVADSLQFARIADPWQRAPRLTRVVVMDDDAAGEDRDEVSTFSSFLGDARAPAPSTSKPVVNCSPDDLAFLIYTSGTTGRPKGAMISHRNHMAASQGTASTNLMGRDDLSLLFLPLAHCFAQALLGVWFISGSGTAFARRIETVVDDLGATHPTCFAGVPRLYEKVYNKVVADGSATPGLKGFLFRKTIAAVEHWSAARVRGRRYMSFWLAVGRLLVLPKIRARLSARMGGRLTWMVSGGAPLGSPIIGLFDACGLPLYEGYGLTECMGPAVVNYGPDRRLGTVGLPNEGITIRIASDGEIFMKGDAVMSGYWNQPEASRLTVDEEGWLHTGDIGTLGPDGRLSITDRKKDIIVTANGKKVAPQNAENALKTCLLVSQVVVYGDRRPYLTALVTVNEESSRAHLRQRNVSDEGMDFSSVSKHPMVRALIQESFDRHNAHVGRFEQIRRFVVLDHDFTLEAGDMTATLKLRRDRVVKRYAEIFDAMYATESLLRRSFTIIQMMTRGPQKKRASDG